MRAGRGVEPVHRREDQPHVSGRRAQAERREQPREQGEDLGIGLGRALAREDLVAHLQIFAGPGLEVILLAKDLAPVAVAGGFGAMGHVHLHDRTVKSGRSIISPRIGSLVT